MGKHGDPKLAMRKHRKEKTRQLIIRFFVRLEFRFNKCSWDTYNIIFFVLM